MIDFEYVKNNIDFEQVASDNGIIFNGAGKAFCPFHEDAKTPNLHNYKSHGYCFTCNKSVDAIDLEAKYKDLNKSDAAVSIAKRYGLSMDKVILKEYKSIENKKDNSKKDQALKLMKRSANYWNKILKNHPNILEWLRKSKGLTLEDIDKWKIGFADDNNTISGYLYKEPTNLQIAEQIGLIHKDKSGQFYDHFQKRIIFPVWNSNRIVFITGRAYPDGDPKYLHLKNSELVYKEIAFKENLNVDKCIVVESISDAIAFIKSGFPCIALLGTNPGQKNIDELKEAKADLYICFDNDEAGKRASNKLAKEIECNVINFESGDKDPDELLSELGESEFSKVIHNALENAKSYLSIIEEEKLKSNFKIKQSIHPSMDFIDGHLIYGLNLDGKAKFIRNRIVYNDKQINQKYQLHKLPTFSRFSGKGIADYLNNKSVSSFNTYTNIRKLLTDHIVFSENWQPDVIATWIFGTYIHRCFDLFPYLWINSPTKRCGKTKLLELIAELSYNSNGIETAPTEAVLFRQPDITASTLIWDEAENFHNMAEKGERLSILNAAYRKTGRVPRCEGDKHDVVYYGAYRPIALAGISSMPDTIDDRSIQIVLTRKTTSQKIERLQIDRLSKTTSELRNELYMFGLNKAHKAVEAHNDFKDDLIPPNVDDRLRDGFEVLMSVAAAIVYGQESNSLINTLKSASSSISGIKNNKEEDNYYVHTIKILKDEIDKTGDDELILTSKYGQELLYENGIDWVTEQKHARKVFRDKFNKESKNYTRNGKSIRGYRFTKRDIYNLYESYYGDIPQIKASFA